MRVIFAFDIALRDFMHFSLFTAAWSMFAARWLASPARGRCFAATLRRIFKFYHRIAALSACVGRQPRDIFRLAEYTPHFFIGASFSDRRCRACFISHYFFCRKSAARRPSLMSRREYYHISRLIFHDAAFSLRYFTAISQSSNVFHFAFSPRKMPHLLLTSPPHRTASILHLFFAFSACQILFITFSLGRHRCRFRASAASR